jgi:sulfur-oxidizing protein SoxY
MTYGTYGGATSGHPAQSPPHRARLDDSTRRGFLVGSTSFALALTIAPPAEATPQSMRAAIRKIAGESPVKRGRIKLELPPLIENGNSVPLTIVGESPMTAADHIQAIHVFTEKNPQPNVVSVQIGPRAGRAQFSTRIRLADSQRVVAVAQMSDGSFWSEEADIVVTLAACLEEG